MHWIKILQRINRFSQNNKNEFVNQGFNQIRVGADMKPALAKTKTDDCTVHGPW